MEVNTNKHTTFEIIAFVSAIMSALISAILLGIVFSFMIVTRDQQQEVRTVKTGDISWICLDTKDGDRIVAESCQILPHA